MKYILKKKVIFFLHHKKFIKVFPKWIHLKHPLTKFKNNYIQFIRSVILNTHTHTYMEKVNKYSKGICRDNFKESLPLHAIQGMTNGDNQTSGTLTPLDHAL